MDDKRMTPAERESFEERTVKGGDASQDPGRPASEPDAPPDEKPAGEKAPPLLTSPD